LLPSGGRAFFVPKNLSANKADGELGLMDFIRRSFFVAPKEQADDFMLLQRGCFTLSVIFDFELNNSINQKFGG